MRQSKRGMLRLSNIDKRWLRLRKRSKSFKGWEGCAIQANTCKLFQHWRFFLASLKSVGIDFYPFQRTLARIKRKRRVSKFSILKEKSCDIAPILLFLERSWKPWTAIKNWTPSIHCLKIDQDELHHNYLTRNHNQQFSCQLQPQWIRNQRK